jgi:hypothetical protein
MSNNPGKKGKPAPWVKRAREHRQTALRQYLRDHHPAYDEWCTRRSEAASEFHKQAVAKHPGILGVSDAIKAENRKLSKWDRENHSPLTWEDSKRLEAEFDALYVQPDFS